MVRAIFKPCVLSWKEAVDDGVTIATQRAQPV